MRKIIVTEYISLDGVVEEPGHWSFDFWNDEAAKYKYDELFTSDALLLGRLTYEGFAKAWPTMKETGEFGKKMNTMQKYVVSKTVQNAEWQNTEIIAKDVLQEVKKLKKQHGKNILVAGSGQLVHTLLQENLADEYRFLLHPVVLGKGKRLFREESDKRKLTLFETQKFSTGIVALHYKPAK